MTRSLIVVTSIFLALIFWALSREINILVAPVEGQTDAYAEMFRIELIGHMAKLQEERRAEGKTTPHLQIHIQNGTETINIQVLNQDATEVLSQYTLHKRLPPRVAAAMVKITIIVPLVANSATLPRAGVFLFDKMHQLWEYM